MTARKASFGFCLFAFACVSAPARKASPELRSIPEAPTSTRVAAPPAQAGSLDERRPCAAGEYTESDVFDTRRLDCAPPNYCSPTFWEHVKERARVPGTPLDVELLEKSACVVRTERGHVDWVTVTPEGEPPFVVRVHDVQTTVVPGAGDEPSEVLVRGHLTFHGRSRIASFGVARGLSLLDGRLRTGRRTRAVPRSLGDGRVEVDLMLADDVTAFDTVLSCASLATTEEPHSPALRVDTGGMRPVRSSRVSLFATARGENEIDIATPLLKALEASGSRTRVRLTMDDGAELAGWVPTEAFEPGEGGGSAGYGTGSSCGCRSDGPRPTIRVAVRSRTAVYSRAGSGRWATLFRPVELNAVEIGSDWLLLEGFSRFGIYETFGSSVGCDDLRVFVKREDARVVGPVRY